MDEISAFSVYNKKKSPKKPKKPKKVKANPKKAELIANILQAGEVTTPAKTLPKNKAKTVKSAKPQNGTPERKKKTPKKLKRLQDAAPNAEAIQQTSKPQSKKSKKKKEPVEKFVNAQKIAEETLTKEDATNHLTPSRIKAEQVTPSSGGRQKDLPPMTDSIQEGLNVFKYLLAPIQVSTFFDEFWEKEPCLVQRDDVNYFSNLISFQAINQMLIDNHVEFTKHIDVTSYKDGIRETLNPEGRALPGTVWDFFESGCSVRLLNPQIFIPAIFTLNTTLQEYFHCMVGANVYLTPPSSQGFAPHYDDIEAFVLQIEGQKRWKLYNPRSAKERLPRTSSINFNQDEIGEPILDKVLKPGDILYFPRGTIHQAKTEGEKHSLHITLSVYQKQSYADLFEIMFPMMLSKAVELNVNLRKGLPMNIWYNCGLVNSDKRSKDREHIITKCRELLHQVVAMMPLDDAVDQMAKKYLHDALPPDLTSKEVVRTFHASRYNLNADGNLDCNMELTETTKIRLIRANILRLVEENDKFNIYFYADNSKEYHEYDPNFLEISPEDAPSVEFLISCYPEYVAIRDLPLENNEDKFSVVQGLFDRGLLMLERAIN